MRRYLFITLWIVIACFAWLAIVGGSLWALYWAAPRLVRSLSRSVPDWAVFGVIIYGLFGAGCVAAMAITAKLGLRGALPGTQSGSVGAPRPGFPVVSVSACNNKTLPSESTLRQKSAEAKFQRFTWTSRSAVGRGNQATHRLGGHIIGDVELLLGILREPNAFCTVVLSKLGVDLAALASQLERQPRALNDGPAPERLPQTREFKLAIESAIAIARDLGHEHVGTEHMLLGLLQYPDLASSRILAEHGITRELARKTILELMSAEGAKREK